MEFFHLRAGEEFIRLGQVLKAAGFVENGGSNTRRICQCKRRS
jgi:ribosome-associated protein YbcJ (S4-like RNA binding protein)